MAIVVLVILAGLSAALALVGSSSQVTSALDIQSARATAAANAGLEYGLYRTVKPAGAAAWGTCSCPDPATCSDKVLLDLSADTGHRVLVWCDSKEYFVGPDEPGTPTPLTQRVAVVSALACSSSSCPDPAAAATIGYTERKRSGVLLLD